MKKSCICLLLFLTAKLTFSQQLFHQTQYMVNPYTLNPALAGSEDFIDIKAGYRSQWLGLDDSQGYSSNSINPKTMYLSAHSAIGNDHSYYHDPKHEHNGFHGVGGFVTSDKVGEIESNSMYGSYSYNMLLIKSRKVGPMYHFNSNYRHIGLRMVIGAHLGVFQQKINFDELVSYTQIEGLGLDPYLLEQRSNKWGPDGSLGIWLYSNKFYLGSSVRRILGNSVKLNSNSDINFNLSRHYNVMGGLNLLVSNFIEIHPSMNVKIEQGSKTSVDLNTLVYYNTIEKKGQKLNALQLYGGATYRHGSAIAFLIGTVIQNRFELIYSFDVTTNKLRSSQNGGHEITIGYRILPRFSLSNAEDRRSNH